jgi:small-conductance mechanosensitive channel
LNASRNIVAIDVCRSERREQANILLNSEILNNRGLQGARLVLGDFNEWMRGLAIRLLSSQFHSVEIHKYLGRSRTYPGILPLTIKNEEIIVPSLSALGSAIINYSARAHEHGLILHTNVTIGYDAPWRRVHELLIQAAERTSRILKHPKPFVLQTGLDDFFVSYQLNAYTDQANQMALIYSELHQHIQDCFNESGVELLSPHY